MPRRRRRSREHRPFPILARWFIAFGIVGIVVALVMLYALSHDFIPADYALILWPTSMVLLAADDGFWLKGLITAFAFGGNFVLYGLIGLLAGVLAKRIKPVPSPSA